MRSDAPARTTAETRIDSMRRPGAATLSAILAAILLLPVLHRAMFRPHKAGVDGISLANPPYMYVHTGRLAYPVHAWPDAMVVHPPIKTGTVGLLMRAGASRYTAEALVSLTTLVPAVVLAALLPAALGVRAALLFGMACSFMLLKDSFHLRPDLDVFGAWILGLILLEWGRLAGWRGGFLAAGSFFLTMASGTHYYALPAAAGVLVYGAALIRGLGRRQGFRRASWLAGGVGAFGIPYLVMFVLPQWPGIRTTLEARDAVAGPAAAFAATVSSYRELQGLPDWTLRALTWLPATGVPLAPLAILVLLWFPATRFLASAAAPLPLFVSLAATLKHPAFFSHEMLLAGMAAAMMLGVGFRRLVRGTWGEICAAPAAGAAMAVLLLGDGVRSYLRWESAPLDEMDLARAAGRNILGPDARVGYRLSLWYIGGEAHWYLIDGDLHWPEHLSVYLPNYLRVFDAIAVNRHSSDVTSNRDNVTVSALYARGDLSLRGFFIARHDIDCGYLLLCADRPDKIVGFAHRDNRLYRFEENPTGGSELLSAVCEAGSGAVLGSGALAWHYLALPPQNSRRQVVTMVFRGTAPALPPGCRERLRTRGDLSEQAARRVVEQLRRTDRVVRFHEDLFQFAGPERRRFAGRAWGDPPEDAMLLEPAIDLTAASAASDGAHVKKGPTPVVHIPAGSGRFGLKVPLTAQPGKSGPCWVEARVTVSEGSARLAARAKDSASFLVESGVLAEGARELFLKVPECGAVDEILARNANPVRPASIRIESLRLWVAPPAHQDQGSSGSGASPARAG